MKDTYYENIKECLINDELYSKVKDYSKERHRVITYFEIGSLLHEAGKEYGKNIIKQYAEKLRIDIGTKYNVNNLYKMRKFYEIFSNQKLYAVRTTLSWTHYRELLSLNDTNEILYYLNLTERKNLSYR